MYYNLASLALGLVSWGFGFTSLLARTRKSRYQLSSFICCCAALVLQFYEIKRRMRVDDWIGVDDTISAICFAAVTLTAVTVFLNLLCERSKKGGD